MQTERVTILMTPAKKAALAARAASRNMSIGRYVRQRIEGDEEDLTPPEATELAALVDQVNLAMPKMQAALDSMDRTLDETHAEVDRLLREAGIRR